MTGMRFAALVVLFSIQLFAISMSRQKSYMANTGWKALYLYKEEANPGNKALAAIYTKEIKPYERASKVFAVTGFCAFLAQMVVVGLPIFYSQV